MPLIGDLMQLPSQELLLHKVLTLFVCFQPLPSLGFRCLLAKVSLYNSWTGGPVRAHPTPYEFAMDPQIGTHFCFIARLCIIHTHSHAGIQHFHPAPSRSFIFAQSYSGDSEQ
jgi:hypothetical protein